ncbi:MAG: HAD family hydrolase [Lentisphaerae bacterium]|jgi:D-glycero-D-manno-heptose 1,7-bisphosphate phosphatase|nr:HAD family hydrolase [Lentisphaerota bacterium]
MKAKVVFLDRDGTIIVDKNYLSDPAGIEFFPNALEGLKAFQAFGYQLVMITNQSGIGRGYFTENDLKLVHDRLKELLQDNRVQLLDIFYCPHAPEENCTCRKPKTGMLIDACQKYNVDLESAAMIGDSKVDVNLAKNFGITAIQVTNGTNEPLPNADYVAKDLLDAANWMRKKQS